MWKRLREWSDDEESSSETLSDLSLSMLGVMMIAFTGYVLKFRSELVAAAQAQAPQFATEPLEEEIRRLQMQVTLTEQQKRELRDQVAAGAQALGNPQLFGLNGPLTNVVFCLDLSGSMIGQSGPSYSQSPEEMQERFDEVKERLKLMVRSLAFRNFSVVGFGGEANEHERPRLLATSTTLVGATPQAREEACRQIDAWPAVGATPTLPALRAAYGMPGVEHVILLTDGLPTVEGTQEEVLRFVSGAESGGAPPIVVDVIGIGDQTVQEGNEMTMALLDFTRAVARATGGFFQAW